MVNGANIKIGVAAHSVRSVPAADLPIVASTGLELEAPVHVHVSEQRAENEACFAHHGVSPTRLLADTGLLTPATTAVHATHLAAGDIELYAGTGSSACFCPSTERDLGDGVGLARELADHGIDLCLGSDSNATVDLFREAQALEMNDRLRWNVAAFTLRMSYCEPPPFRASRRSAGAATSRSRPAVRPIFSA